MPSLEFSERAARDLKSLHGHSGYIALHQYDSKRDRILVKTIRHQREAGLDEA